MRLGLAMTLTVCWVAVMSGPFCVAAMADDRDGSAVAYSVRITGLTDDLADLAQSISETVKRADAEQPETRAILERRTEADRARLSDLLTSEGYYDGTIAVTIDERPDHALRVTFAIETGIRYTFDTVHVTTAGDEEIGSKYGLSPDLLGLTPGSPARAAPVLAAEMRIQSRLQAAGLPQAAVTGHRVVIDEATKRMDITYRVAPGSVALFGPPDIAGLSRLDPQFVLNRLRWREGHLFDRSLIDATRDDLIATGLFTSVTITPVQETPTDRETASNRVAIRIRLVERLPRTIAGGLAYSTSQGIGANASFEHRNLFGQGEHVSTTLKIGQDQRTVQAASRRPDLFARHQDLVATFSLDQQDQPAFQAFGGQAQLGFERQLDPQIQIGFGVRYEKARLSAAVSLGAYTLVSTPLFARRDTTNDLLNPTRGNRIALTLTPSLRALGGDLTYLQAKVTASTYHNLSADDHWVLALRGAIGATAGGGIATIPRDHLFFAGGGGSVRGFGFQKAGPRDTASEPSGGRSTLEAGLDLRIRLSEEIGLVPFLDAGTVYRAALPTVTGKIFLGAGLGLRYYSAVGPLRLDLATPLNPRRTGDAALQLYVSLGQAF